MTDDERPKYPDPPKIRARISLRPDGDDIVTSISDRESDISVQRQRA